jgi:hypothetical protein
MIIDLYDNQDDQTCSTCEIGLHELILMETAKTSYMARKLSVHRPFQILIPNRISVRHETQFAGNVTCCHYENIVEKTVNANYT